jgi:hypothetical protein
MLAFKQFIASLVLAPLMVQADPPRSERDQYNSRLRAQALNLGTPLNCTGHSNSRFAFELLATSSKNKKFSKENACQLIYEYENHVYDNVGAFWPIQKNLGLTLEIQTKADRYNASFNPDLFNEFQKPFLNLIYINGIPAEPQKYVWSHEYGHAVLDDHVRTVLNERFDLDRKLRDLTFKTTKSSKKLENLENENHRLYEASNVIRAENEKISKIYDAARKKFDAASDDLQSLVRTQKILHSLNKDIENKMTDIKNNFRDLLNQQGHLDGVSDKYNLAAIVIEEREDSCNADTLCSTLSKGTRIYTPNKERVEQVYKDIIHNEQSLSRLYQEKKKFPADLSQQIKAAQNKKDQLEIPYKKADADLVKIRESVVKIDQQMGTIRFQIGLEKYEQIKNTDLSLLPGFDSLSNYHEFFADLFAAIYHQDSNAIGDALIQIFPKYSQEYADARRFSPLNTTLYQLDSWTNPGGGPHAFFSPVRTALNLEHIVTLDRNTKGKEVLKAALKVITDLVIKHTFDEQDDSFYSYTAVASEVAAIQTKNEMVSFLESTATNRKITSNFVSHYDLKNWCESNFSSCKNFISAQLRKGRRGFFKTGMRVAHTNRVFYTRLAKELENI